MAWTDQMVEDLRVMWKQGLTTAEIGKKLGVSKNSIVGKVHRLGLSGRPSPIKKKDENQEEITAAKPVLKEKSVTVEKTEPRKEVSASVAKEENKPVAKEETKSVKPSVPVAEKVAEKKDKPKDEVQNCLKSEQEKSAKTVSLMELDNHTCRWPLGDPKDDNFHFCGKKVKIGQTYCEEHSTVAYVKPGKPK